ncbi:MAG TPA: hypothetical protein DCS93_08240 [Microscillaceae bacterium]|nr:hypothetical protein [Microscillaceae bacterium]
MHHYCRFLLIPVGVLFFLNITQGQSIVQGNATLDTAQKTITIPYTIQDMAPAGASKAHQYHLRLYYTQDGGKTFVGPLKKVIGHEGSQILPGQKKIIWNYTQESGLFTGNQVQFKISGNYKPSVIGLQGPKAVLNSLLVPGWGKRKVYPHDSFHHRFWYVPTIAVSSLLLVGALAHTLREDSYRQYLRATNNQEANTSYELAQRQHRVFVGTWVVASVIWLADIAMVAIRGISNQRNQRQLIQKNQQMDQKLGITTSYDFSTQQPNIGFRIKF